MTYRARDLSIGRHRQAPTLTSIAAMTLLTSLVITMTYYVATPPEVTGRSTAAFLLGMVASSLLAIKTCFRMVRRSEALVEAELEQRERDQRELNRPRWERIPAWADGGPI